MRTSSDYTQIIFSKFTTMTEQEKKKFIKDEERALDVKEFTDQWAGLKGMNVLLECNYKGETYIWPSPNELGHLTTPERWKEEKEMFYKAFRADVVRQGNPDLFHSKLTE